MDTLIIAPTHYAGHHYADDHGIPRKSVIIPGQSRTVIGRRYDTLHILEGVHLSQRQAYDIVPGFLAAPDADNIIPRIAALVPNTEGD